MQVDWSVPALWDVEAIRSYIAKHDPAVANSVAALLFGAGNSLQAHPNRGQVGRIKGTRELIVERRWIVVYEVDEATNVVDILRVWSRFQQRD